MLITGKLASYRVAHRTTMSTVERRQNTYVNNRCENSRQPSRQRERAMKGFRSAGSAQRFLASFSRISPHFRPPRHRMTAPDHRTELAARFQVWDQVTEQALAA
ncbi:DDE-type integrase/transposase/recombinase [Rhodococcus erythropolis]|uniref:DDE-type integrase/transposase/recombinase n=1 Tax=Rhodococcus erythropolis TaxID=1833 RepID=UPI0029493F34|nr:DDE-type integrase/transposase/recombinase [Rhodococcus erythropolis]MDV6277925.1 DDE-type integrase/transposase/recombinase [Rhodococcus erythropolis]